MGWVNGSLRLNESHGTVNVKFLSKNRRSKLTSPVLSSLVCASSRINSRQCQRLIPLLHRLHTHKHTHSHKRNVIYQMTLQSQQNKKDDCYNLGNSVVDCTAQCVWQTRKMKGKNKPKDRCTKCPFATTHWHTQTHDCVSLQRISLSLIFSSCRLIPASAKPLMVDSLSTSPNTRCGCLNIFMHPHHDQDTQTHTHMHARSQKPLSPLCLWRPFPVFLSSHIVFSCLASWGKLRQWHFLSEPSASINNGFTKKKKLSLHSGCHGQCLVSVILPNVLQEWQHARLFLNEFDRSVMTRHGFCLPVPFWICFQVCKIPRIYSISQPKEISPSKSFLCDVCSLSRPTL